MKKIALLPFKNESKFLPTYLASVKPVCDEIIAYDDGSIDDGRKILEAAGAIVVNDLYLSVQEKSGWAELGIRNKLLQLGREAGGTHFVCLDADETFTKPFINKADAIFSKMQPGNKLLMQWLAMWKSVDHYRDDHSVWSNNFKDFAFCDDGKMKYPDVWMHTPRTPGPTNDEVNLTLNPVRGAVMHFQFSEFANFQMKQCFLRAAELIKLGQGHWKSINQKYSITLDDPNAKVKAIQYEWAVDPMPQMSNEMTSWRKNALFEYFNQYGIEFFELLEIWHIPLLKQEFVSRIGREPFGS
jgi:glycosyltransferase involved in cell wall biosynthesis